MFLSVLGYSVLAGAATIMGTLLILYKYDWAKHNSIHLMSFAAGIMLALSFLHLIPAAIHVGRESKEQLVAAEDGEAHAEEVEREAQFAFIVVLLGFTAFYALESMINLHPRHNVDTCSNPNHSSLGMISVTGLAFHSVIDGIIIAVGFRAGSPIGIMTTVAVILHEMPEGMITTSILLHTEMKRAKAFWFSALVAVATPVGAVVSYFVLGEASENTLKTLLAAAAGSFIYIAAADLIPETHEKEKWLNTVVLIMGMAALYVVGLLLGRGH